MTWCDMHDSMWSEYLRIAFVKYLKFHNNKKLIWTIFQNILLLGLSKANL